MFLVFLSKEKHSLYAGVRLSVNINIILTLSKTYLVLLLKKHTEPV